LDFVSDAAPSLQPAPERGITRTDSTYERGHVGGAGQVH
jgi:hypothetical protein